MPKLNTTSVSLAVTPTVVSTLFSHYLNRGPLKERPTAHLSYDEGLHLVKSFLEYASHHTVEELQAFTAQWVPHPQWVKVEDAIVSEAHLKEAARLLQEQLGEDGIRRVGGREWWQWRKDDAPLEAEWIEMKSDAAERKANGGKTSRVMLYIHGGGYYFGSVDEHRYQMQRHARKLKARVFAPRYRLAPQFPFPCGLLDTVAAYLHLLTVQDPKEIVLAGDSAGGGMVMAALCVLRDQGIPLPAGAILISPWVDLTHSFPSVGNPAPMDYIPQYGFHHKPSRSWPPPNEDDAAMLVTEADKKKRGKAGKLTTGDLQSKQQDPVATSSNERVTEQDGKTASAGTVHDPQRFLSVDIDGKTVKLKDQIQLYTTNELLDHPLVSPILQPTLGGLPPLLIMVGGAEILRDEQIYLAHKCANPSKYAPPPEKMDEHGRTQLAKYEPTDVQLQVWEDLCHVAPTLSFTRPAKYMYRSVAQFGAWCLARAQRVGIEIPDDDDISFISTSGSATGEDAEATQEDSQEKKKVKEDHTETKKQEDHTEKKKQEEERIALEQENKSGAVGKAGDALPPFVNHMVRQRVTRHGVTHPLPKAEELDACKLKPEEVGVIKSGQVKKWLTAKNLWDSKYATTKAKVHKKITDDMVAGYHTFPGEKPPPTALAGRRRIGEKSQHKKRVKSLGLAVWSLWGSKHDEATVARERERKASHAEPPKETTTVSPNDGEGARPFSDIEPQAPSTAPLEPTRSPFHNDSATPGSRERSLSRSRMVYDENQTGEPPIEEHTPMDSLMGHRKASEKTAQNLAVPAVGATGKRPFIDGIALPFSINKEAETASMVTLDSAMSPPASRPISPRMDSQNGVQRPGIETFVTAQEEIPRVGNSQNGSAPAQIGVGKPIAT